MKEFNAIVKEAMIQAEEKMIDNAFGKAQKYGQYQQAESLLEQTTRLLVITTMLEQAKLSDIINSPDFTSEYALKYYLAFLYLKQESPEAFDENLLLQLAAEYICLEGSIDYISDKHEIRNEAIKRRLKRNKIKTIEKVKELKAQSSAEN